MNSTWFRFACAALLLPLAVSLPAQITRPGHRPDDSLRVLFVGHDPAAPDMRNDNKDDVRKQALYRERTAAWESLLRYHFRNVRVVHGADYKVEMSDKVDVTVFDTVPTPVTPMFRGKDPDTGETIYRPASYLPKSFDRPALMISSVSSRIGEPLGSKLDWL